MYRPEPHTPPAKKKVWFLSFCSRPGLKGVSMTNRSWDDMAMKGTTMSLPGTKHGIRLWKICPQEGWKSCIPQKVSHVTFSVLSLT